MYVSALDRLSATLATLSLADLIDQGRAIIDACLCVDHATFLRANSGPPVEWHEPTLIKQLTLFNVAA
jgi:hypothetical protein